jgi:hypothetical protein
MEVIFLHAVEYHLRFPSDVRHCFKASSLQFHFNLGNKMKSQGGEVQRVGRMGKDNHVVSHRLCGFQGCVDGRVVMTEQCCACSNSLLRSPGKLHNRSQQCLWAHGLSGDSLREWVINFFNIFYRFAGTWSLWKFGIFNWHSIGLLTWMPFKHHCLA